MRWLLLLVIALTQSQLLMASDYQRIDVKNTSELTKALTLANKQGFIEIVLADGVYPLKSRLSFRQNNIRLISASGNPKSVILRGQGMSKRQAVEILVDVQADFIVLSGITLENSSNHLIQVRAEADADYFVLNNAILRDSYEQMLKVSGEKGESKPTSDFGVVSHTLFEYSEGIGPQYYIGGIDAHKSKKWRVENNTFRDIASPGDHIAQHAIHFWNGSSDTLVIGNTIVNCDRGIGFGLGNEGVQHSGGKISRNIIVHTDENDPFPDVGIVLESAPDAVIDNNSIFLHSGYSNAIEYRFASTTGVIIANNVTNKRIKELAGAQAELIANRTVGNLLSVFQ